MINTSGWEWEMNEPLLAAKDNVIPGEREGHAEGMKIWNIKCWGLKIFLYAWVIDYVNGIKKRSWKGSSTTGLRKVFDFKLCLPNKSDLTGKLEDPKTKILKQWSIRRKAVWQNFFNVDVDPWSNLANLAQL